MNFLKEPALNNVTLSRVIRKIRKANKNFQTPVVTRISRKPSPFKVLVSCILSLRTRDEVTEAATERLFSLADNPEKMVSLIPKVIEQAIYPVAFYRNKTKTLLEICRTLRDKYSGRVPDSLDELLKLKGVGRKTANLTLILGYGKMGICVDTHVHRITYRWGYVKTTSPEKTEFALREKLPKKYWMEINDLLVTFGQNICKPISPFCGKCCVSEFCEKVGVKRHR